jgi:membrane protease YdiL (CAAX protease family)
MQSRPPWQAEAVIQLIAGVFGCLCLGVLAVGLLRKADVAGFQSPDGFGGVLVATLSFQGAIWILLLVFLRRHGVAWRDALGGRNSNLKKSLLLAVGALALALPVVLGLQQLSVLTLDKLGWPPQDQHAVDLLANTKFWWLRVYLVFFAVVLAPVAEEFIFRGVLFPFLKQLGWPKLAWLGVSVLFALIHVNAPTFVPLVALALVFTWLYEKTDCLLAPILAHSLFNSANLVLLFLRPHERI